MKYLGIDFGLRRIGLSVSEGDLASPLNTIEIKNFKDGVSKIVEFVRENGAEKIVVGLPEGKIGKTVLGFIKALRKNGLEVFEADETLSSQMALKNMIEQGVPKKKRGMEDCQAAAIILQNYLDSKE